jgi:VWFA-related protein
VSRFSQVAVLAALIASSPLAQDQPPRFRGGIDLLTVDAVVLGPEGRPVNDLSAGDFTVTIAGEQRKVLVARFYGAAGAALVASASARPSSAHVSNLATGAGRSVLLVIDRPSIQAGAEKALLEASARVLDALEPGDAAGLVGLPSGRFELTREHARVRGSVRQMTGTMPPSTWRWHITWEEAAGIARRDQRLLAQVLDRECRPPRAGRPVRVVEGCDHGVVMQSAEMLLVARSQAQTTLANLGAIADGVAAIRGPKHMVLISGGLRFDQELLSEFNRFTEQAARAGLILHVIHADQPQTDATTRHRVVTSAFGGRDMSEGLKTIAGMTGGSFFQGVGSAAGVFDRIAIEITSHYQLAVQTTATDMTAGIRDIKVSVARPAVTVRARSRIGPPIAFSAGDDGLAKLLQQPTDVAGLPIELATYATRGNDQDRLRVLIAGQIAIDQPAAGEWGFAVLNEGNAVATGRRVMTADTTTPWTISGAANLVPGTYRLRLAAIAADGRTGVIDVPLIAGLRAAGSLQTSDLIVGIAESSRLQPLASIPPGTDLHAMLEVMSSNVEELARARGVLEIIPGGTAVPVQRHLMAARSGPIDTILLHEARIDTTALAPGRYSASVLLQLDGQQLARVVRLFEIAGGAK